MSVRDKAKERKKKQQRGEAVQNAVSIAATAITMGALICEVPEKEPENAKTREKIAKGKVRREYGSILLEEKHIC